MSSTILAPFQLLELNVVSAQDLAPVSRTMRTYAVAWVHPDRKLSTRVDTNGHNNPTWNDKFVFRVDEEFLHEDTSAVMIEIYALHWFRDVHVGTIRVLVGNLIPPSKRTYKHYRPQVGMRFVALQVRRPSGRPQGILNIGVALLHSSMRSMPLYSQQSTSAVGYKELMMGESSTHEYSNRNPKSNSSQQLSIAKPQFRRTKSDSSSMLGSDMRAKQFREKGKKSEASSEINSYTTSTKHKKKTTRSKASSLLSGSSSSVMSSKKGDHKNGKKAGSSLVSGAGHSELILDSKTMSSSIDNSSEADSEMPAIKVFDEIPTVRKQLIESSPKEIIKPSPKLNNIIPTPARTTPGKSPLGKFQAATPGKSPYSKFQAPLIPGPYEYMTPARKSNMVGKMFMTESELGPSASEVAAAISNNKAANDNEGSVVAYSIDVSVEGLQSKLERWKTELPPVYDRSGREISSYKSNEAKHTKNHTGGGSENGLFSCFSNICGCQCSIVCGENKDTKKKAKDGKIIPKGPSADNLSYMF